ncbi:MAG: phosphoribosyltransferase [Pseudomonadota bacterium]
MQRYPDRHAAGKVLAQGLAALAGHPDAVVLALPRGGVPVGFAIAQALKLPLDIVLVRKLGVPGNEEYAMGAVASGGARVMQPDVVEMLGIEPIVVEAIVERELRTIAQREQSYRAGRAPLPLAAKIVILADDGLATGSTMRVAVEVVRQQGPQCIILAVPVGAPDSLAAFEGLVDEIACPCTPMVFRAVSQWYDDFSETSDEEVCQLLERASAAPYASM